ncbi:PQQ-binding-like beta-propeller repeat protein [Cognataquiflexum nitidum]|uniref:outer membrane protein assembly factor BamB family protein n=1 Tax=Cognataquiflexum nitidum TaxID=2922272 RepID=UPI001F12DCEF|nr:hypothetical protein [Cognataquiflexum nitidum]
MLILLVFQGIAQSSKIQVNQVPIGYSFVQNDSINAVEYQFDKMIIDYYLDTPRNTFTLKLREVNKKRTKFLISGEILFFDLSEARLKWSKLINYATTEFQQFPDYLLESSLTHSYSLNLESGEIKWEAKTDIYHIHKPTNIGIGYPFLKPGQKPSNVLKGIDINTGEELWKRIIHRDYGWNDVITLNDSTVGIVASGIQAVNIHDGSGWAYYTTTGTEKIDGKSTAAMNAVGLGLGLLTGFYYYGVGINVVTDIVSNAIYSDNRLYLTSYEKISCIDALTGKVIWSNPLSDNLVSSGYLYMDNGLLYQLNLDRAQNNGRLIKMGVPYLVVYDPNTGKQGFYTPFTFDGFVLDHQMNETSIDILSNQDFVRLDKKSGQIIKELNLTLEKGEEYVSRWNFPVFFKENEKFYNLLEENPQAHFISTLKNQLIMINENLEYEGKFSLFDFYKVVGKYEDLLILQKDGLISIINHNQIEIASIKNKGVAIVSQNFLLIIQDESVKKLDLDLLRLK